MAFAFPGDGVCWVVPHAPSVTATRIASPDTTIFMTAPKVVSCPLKTALKIRGELHLFDFEADDEPDCGRLEFFRSAMPWSPRLSGQTSDFPELRKQRACLCSGINRRETM